MDKEIWGIVDSNEEKYNFLLKRGFIQTPLWRTYFSNYVPDLTQKLSKLLWETQVVKEFYILTDAFFWRWNLSIDGTHLSRMELNNVNQILESGSGSLITTSSDNVESIIADCDFKKLSKLYRNLIVRQEFDLTPTHTNNYVTDLIDKITELEKIDIKNLNHNDWAQKTIKSYDGQTLYLSPYTSSDSHNLFPNYYSYFPEDHKLTISIQALVWFRNYLEIASVKKGVNLRAIYKYDMPDVAKHGFTINNPERCIQIFRALASAGYIAHYKEKDLWGALVETRYGLQWSKTMKSLIYTITKLIEYRVLSTKALEPSILAAFRIWKEKTKESTPVQPDQVHSNKKKIDDCEFPRDANVIDKIITTAMAKR